MTGWEKFPLIFSRNLSLWSFRELPRKLFSKSMRVGCWTSQKLWRYLNTSIMSPLLCRCSTSESLVFQSWFCCTGGIEDLRLRAVRPRYHCTVFSGVTRCRVHIPGWVSPDSCTAGQRFISSDSQRTCG